MLNDIIMVGSILTRKAFTINGGNMGHVKNALKALNHVHSHISWPICFREEMRAKNAATLAYCHKHRYPRSFLRFRAEVMRICQYKRLPIMHQTKKKKKRKRLAPSNGKPDGGICPTYDAECCKVPNMVVICDRE